MMMIMRSVLPHSYVGSVRTKKAATSRKVHVNKALGAQRRAVHVWAFIGDVVSSLSLSITNYR